MIRTRILESPKPRLLVAALGLCLPLLASAGAAADLLATRDGSIIETDGTWKVQGRLVIFKLPDGQLASLKLDEVDLEAMLLGLLERNSANQMAFEYLMAHYLLTRQLDKMAAQLHRLDDFPAFDDLRVPRHCEEALVLHLATTKRRHFDLGRRQIRAETWRRFGEFLRIEREFRPDVSAAFDALRPEFGDTYFFSFVFGQNNAAILQTESSL